MRKISLDLDSIYFSLNVSGDLEKVIYDACNTFETAVVENKEALTEYNDNVRQLLDTIEKYINDINSKMVSIRAINDKYNSILRDTKASDVVQFCENMIAMCENAYGVLENLIKELNDISNMLRQKCSNINRNIMINISNLNNIKNNNNQTLNVIKEFNKTLINVSEKANFITNFKASKIKDYSQIDKEFQIVNKHNGVFSSGGIATTNSSRISRIKLEKDVDEEILIKEKDSNSFFNMLNNEKKVKMPSASLHKLGGKEFISQMNNLGYEIVKNDDSIIDSKGMIHWVKKDDC